MFDMMKMLGKFNDFKSKLEQVKKSLPSITAAAQSSNGQIEVLAHANHQLVSLKINADLLKNESAPAIEKLLLDTINKALLDAAEKGNQEMKNQTQGMLPSIPGVDLSSMLAR